jgi:anthraniloyl-CoA monooxygenase
MKIVCIGGGPSGLYFALLMKKLGAHHDITVVERNKAYDTFGWGVVFSDQTLDNMRQWDRESAAEVEQAFNHWDDIELHIKDRVIRSGGHGFVGIGRKKLLNILQARCEQVGVKLLFEHDVDSDLDFPDADLIVASDGVNSRVRSRTPDIYKPDIVTRPNRFIWLGTQRQYDAFTFLFEKTEHGWFAAHVYKFDHQTSSLSPSSSCTPCSPAASASATKICVCATRLGWKATRLGLLGERPQTKLPHLCAPPCSRPTACAR